MSWYSGAFWGGDAEGWVPVASTGGGGSGDVLGGKGSFDDASYWSGALTGATVSGSVLNLSGAGNFMAKTGILTSGVRYRVEFDFTQTTASAGLRIRTTSGGADLWSAGIALPTSGHINVTFVAGSTDFYLQAEGATFTGTIDTLTITPNANVIQNPGFDLDMNWAHPSGVISGGIVTSTSATTAITQAGVLAASTAYSYSFKYRATSGSGSSSLRVHDGVGVVDTVPALTLDNTWRTVSRSFTTNVGGTSFGLQADGALWTGDLDDISVT